jgi:predicted CXXCH cytochrome family protein
MHRMTRVAGADTIQAPFDGQVFAFKGDRVTMETHDGERFVRLELRDGKTTTYRVTRRIGGRVREDFVGVDVSQPGSAEVVLPASWMIETRTWRYKGYSVMNRERPRLSAGPVWAKTCIFCHNTVPYLATVYDDLYGPGAEKYQGSVTDRLFPPDRQWHVQPADQAALSAALTEDIRALHGAVPGSLPGKLTEAIRATRNRFDAGHLVEVGIGCETCHNGSRQHVDDPRVRPSFDPTSPILSVRPAAATRAEAINRTCARCHTVLFSQYAWTWEGGRRNGDAGGSTINSGEARDFLLGGCSKQMSCAACHDPHRLDDPAGLAEVATIKGNARCVSCHPRYATPDAVAAHTHHKPDGEGSVCVSCHMPKKNMGLRYQLTRYHRIGSPTDRARVEKDRPLECALCHADKSVEDLTATMEKWWSKQYDRAALRALYGPDLGVSTMRATLTRGLAHEQAIGIATYGALGREDMLPELAPLLAHPYPLVRFWARAAIEKITKQPLGIDLDQDPGPIQADVRRWLENRHAP